MITDEVPDGRRVQLLRGAGHPALSKVETRIIAARALSKWACKPVSAIVVCPACSVRRPTGDIFEVKAGPYLPSSDTERAAWAPREGDASCAAYLAAPKTALL